MGQIKEPAGVDFVIKSEPLTDKARQAISAFIRNYKKARLLAKPRQVTAVKKAKMVKS